MRCPCKSDCPERHMNCHSECPKWAEYQKSLEEGKKEKQKEIMLNDVTIRCTFRNKKSGQNPMPGCRIRKNARERDRRRNHASTKPKIITGGNSDSK